MKIIKERHGNILEPLTWLFGLAELSTWKMRSYRQISLSHHWWRLSHLLGSINHPKDPIVRGEAVDKPPCHHLKQTEHNVNDAALVSVQSSSLLCHWAWAGITLRIDSHLVVSRFFGVPRSTTRSTMPIPANQLQGKFLWMPHTVPSETWIYWTGLWYCQKIRQDATQADLHLHASPTLPSMWILLGHPKQSPSGWLVWRDHKECQQLQDTEHVA